MLTNIISAIFNCYIHFIYPLSDPPGGRFSEKYIMFLPSQRWDTVSMFFVHGQDTLPSHAPLDSGVNEYLVGQRWQCV